MLRPSDGIAVRNIGGQQSVSLLPSESPRHPFKVTAHREVSGETVNWWLSIEEGFVRWNADAVPFTANSSGTVTYGGGLLVTADGLATDETIKDAKIEKVNCYKAKRYGTNLLKQNQYKADGNTLVFAYTSNPGGPTPKLAVASVDVFNSHFSPGVNGGFTCTPIIGIKPLGTVPAGPQTEWRRICLNVMPIALFTQATGKVTQYVHDTIDMVVTYETAYTTTYRDTENGETWEEFATRINLNRKWGAYYYETGAGGAPAGYTFET